MRRAECGHKQTSKNVRFMAAPLAAATLVLGSVRAVNMLTHRVFGGPSYLG